MLNSIKLVFLCFYFLFRPLFKGFLEARSKKVKKFVGFMGYEKTRLFAFKIYWPLVVFKVYFVGKSTTQLTPIPTQPASRDRCGNNRKCDNIDKRAHQSAGIKKQNLCYTMTFLWQYLEDWRNNLLLQSGSNKTVLSNYNK